MWLFFVLAGCDFVWDTCASAGLSEEICGPGLRPGEGTWVVAAVDFEGEGCARAESLTVDATLRLSAEEERFRLSGAGLDIPCALTERVLRCEVGALSLDGELVSRSELSMELAEVGGCAASFELQASWMSWAPEDAPPVDSDPPVVDDSGGVDSEDPMGPRFTCADLPGARSPELDGSTLLNVTNPLDSPLQLWSVNAQGGFSRYAEISPQGTWGEQVGLGTWWFVTHSFDDYDNCLSLFQAEGDIAEVSITRPSDADMSCETQGWLDAPTSGTVGALTVYNDSTSDRVSVWMFGPGYSQELRLNLTQGGSSFVNAYVGTWFMVSDYQGDRCREVFQLTEADAEYHYNGP